MFKWLFNSVKKAPSGNPVTKKVICFSLWGNGAKYTRGALANINLQKKHYPEWVNRYYVDDTVPEGVVQELKRSGCEVIQKRGGGEFKGLFWRFEAGFDSSVERFLVRDCDSRLNEREAAAVREWVESGLPFHIMRDNAYHNIPILGGMWGAVSFFIPAFQKHYEKWVNNIQASNHRRGAFFYTDQNFLKEVVWPRIRKKHMAHSSCVKITGKEKPFTVSLPEGRFVGQQFDENERPVCI